jgi:hypothetical protein
MDRFAFLRAVLAGPCRAADVRGTNRELKRDIVGVEGGGCGGQGLQFDGKSRGDLLFTGASCFFDEEGRVLYFAPTPQV